MGLAVHRCGIGPSAAAGGIDFAFLQESESTANATEYTYSAEPLGDVAADRIIIVSVATRKGGAAAFVSSCTIGGVTATKSVEARDDGNTVAIFAAIVPTGATGNIVVTMSVATARCTIGIWRATGMTATAHDNATDFAGDRDVTVSTEADGFAIAAYTNYTGAAPSWTGVASDFYVLTESVQRCAGGSATTSSGTLNITTGGSIGQLAVATWGP